MGSVQCILHFTHCPGLSTIDGSVIAGMFLGAVFVGTHMATTHGVTLAMMSSYIPTTQVAGIGRISGTAWSFTDFIFGEPCHSQTCAS